MRILVAIPHYFAPSPPGQPGKHGSQGANAHVRALALERCIASLHRLLGPHQAMIHIGARRMMPANNQSCGEVHVVVCTAGNRHTLEKLSIDTSLYHHFPCEAEPTLLGFQCHRVMRDRWGNYDYYCYLEDDLILHDPWFFEKLNWFNRHVGKGSLLQPNRFEHGTKPADRKVYVDGDLAPRVTERFQDVSQQPVLNSTVMGVAVQFRRALNPHSGCFFLNAEQMQHWSNQPHFGREDTSFVGPLESAATLGIMRTFRIYKPAPQQANFLEVEHHGDQFVRLIQREKWE
jgi:hypothetical protein